MGIALSPASRARAHFFEAFLGLAPQALFCHLLRVPRTIGLALSHSQTRLRITQTQLKVNAAGQFGKVYQWVAIALFLLNGSVAVALIV